MGTNQSEVSEASVEDRLAAAFEKAGVVDPPQENDEPDEPEAEETAAEAAEPEAQAQPDEATDAAEDIEYEGKAYKLPKELKDALLRQQDYTRKTQDVAELRRTTEQKAQELEVRAKFNETHFAKAVEAHALNSQLQQFAQVDWAGLAENNPSQYLQLDRQHRTLQEAANRVNADMQHLGQQFQSQMLETKQKAQAKCIEELKRDFKDFGPDMLRKLDETGRTFGFSGEELAQVTDPRMIRVLHAAAQYKALQGTKSIVEKKVQDAKPVQVKAARSAQTSQANAQLTEARDRLRKTGKTSDAEAFLAARFAKSMR
jgi:hypothetical protein